MERGAKEGMNYKEKEVIQISTLCGGLRDTEIVKTRSENGRENYEKTPITNDFV